MKEGQNEIASKILNKLNSSNSIAIFCSSPIDYDSVGTTLTAKWWLEKIGKKNVESFTIANIPLYMKKFPGIDTITHTHLDKINFDQYDAILLVDGNSWRQFFTISFENYLYNIPKEKILNIDHHEVGEIEKYIPETCLRIKDCCTSKVFYDYFIKDSKIKLDKEVAEWMYYSLIGDTGTFAYEIYKDTFGYAQFLLNCGVDHYKIASFSVTQKMMDFTVWAIEKTILYPEIKTTILTMNEEDKKMLAEKFGDSWENDDFIKYYQTIFMAKLENYSYGLVFKSSKKDEFTRVNWRTKNVDNPIEIMKVLQNIGFQANGHRNAGGGIIKEHISNVVDKFVEEMSKQLIINNSEKKGE